MKSSTRSSGNSLQPEKNQDPIKPSNFLESVNCAIEGVLWVARTQRHMRIHLLAAVGVLILALYFRISAVEFILLALAVTFVIFAEMFNTAIEVLVDLVSPQYHTLARRAKDVAAGAVLIASIGAVIIGYLALAGYIFPLLDSGAQQLKLHGDEALTIASVVTVLILVVLGKAIIGRGTPLHGGMPSGHSAIAFSIATVVLFSGVGTMVALLTFALATMVSHSRLLMTIHSLREVIAGALLGSVTTFVIYYLFG